MKSGYIIHLNMTAEKKVPYGRSYARRVQRALNENIFGRDPSSKEIDPSRQYGRGEIDGQCEHRWLLGPPESGISSGSCKHCGEKRLFGKTPKEEAEEQKLTPSLKDFSKE